MELLRDRSAEFERAGVQPFGISRDSAWSHIAWSQALDLNFPLALGLEQARRCSAFGVEGRVPRPRWRRGSERRFSSTRTVRSAAHGATTRPRCRTSTSYFAPRRLCSPRRRALPRRRASPPPGLPILDARSQFMSGGAAGRGEAAPGDHLQTLYHCGSSATRSRTVAPRGSTRTRSNPRRSRNRTTPAGRSGFSSGRSAPSSGWSAAGTSSSSSSTASPGCCACAWLRELGLPRGPALAGGLVFAIAPYRVQQSVGHLLGPISILLPLCALRVRARAPREAPGGWRSSGVALASIPLVRAGASCPRRDPVLPRVRRVPHARPPPARSAPEPGRSRRSRAGVLVRETLIRGSTQSGGRSLDEISHYSATRRRLRLAACRHGRSEQFVFLGWATPLDRARRTHPAGPSAPVFARGYSRVGRARADRARARNEYAHLRRCCGTHYRRSASRVFRNGSCRSLASASPRCSPSWSRRSRTLSRAAVAIALVLVDLHARVYEKSAAGRSRRAVVSTAGGRLLELPVFDPGVHYGSVYLWYDTAAQRERPAATRRPRRRRRRRSADRLHRLNCGDWSEQHRRRAARLDIGAITLHRGLYARNPAVPSTGWFAWQEPARARLAVQKTAGPVWLFERARHRPRCRSASSRPRREPMFCQGWFADTGSGRYMSETHAPFWIYGSGEIRARVRSVVAAAACDVDGSAGLDAAARRAGTSSRSTWTALVKVGGREAEGRPEALRVVYIPIAWYPESTYSVVPVTFLASSERR